MSDDTVRCADPAHDDLTRIAALGPDIAERLDEVGIRTYADLGASSANDIAKLLPDVSPLLWGCIDAWRHDAQDMEHVGTGEVRRWAGWAHKAMLAFIQEEAADPAPPALAPPLGPVPAVVAGSVTAGRPMNGDRTMTADRRGLTAAAALRVEPVPVHDGEPFTITMTLEVAGGPLPDHLEYHAVFDAVQLSDGSKRALAQAAGPLATSGIPSIEAKAEGLPTGVYRLAGAVGLREVGTSRPGGANRGGPKDLSGNRRLRRSGHGPQPAIRRMCRPSRCRCP